MAEPSKDSPALRTRMRLSLRWKAFGVLLLLLGIVHAFFGVLVYRQSLQQFRHDENERLAGFRQMFDALLQQSAQGLGRIAAQISASTSAADMASRSLDTAQLSPELLASLTGVQIFDAQGHSLAGFRLAQGMELPVALQGGLLDEALHSHRPATLVWCEDQCTQYVYEPAFDRDGREIMIGLGQPVSETLEAFSRQTGADVALLSDASAGDAGVLFKRRLFAVTHAPSLLPKLKSAVADIASPPVEQAFAGAAASADYRLLLSPLSTGAASRVQSLLILDETTALQRIRGNVRNGILASLLGLALSSAALWLFLTPLSRRLQVVTQALPMLAEQRFAAARATLTSAGGPPRLPDEIDLLTDTARWLTAQLEQLKGAEAASAAKSRFLATLSHEIRTPLNGILGMLEVLQYSELEVKQRQSIRMVHESAQSLLRVMDDTLDLARIEAGRIDLDAAPFSIEQVVAGCVESAALRARSKSLKLIAYVDPALPPLVVGDAMRLRQILGNLCSNAVKFTAAGRVVVRAEPAEVAGTQVSIRFSVQDTGIGIPLEAQPNLFQPFQQGAASIAARFGGSGLGLSICQGLVKKMGGRISFVSFPGTGSIFRFSLEFPIAKAAVAEAPQSLAGVAIALHIVEPDERGWLAAYLESAGASLREGAPLTLRDAGSLGVVVEGGPSRSERLSYPLHRATLLHAVARAAGLAVKSAPQPPPEPPARALRILAVDDHPTNRHVIQTQLNLLGHDTATAADGREALQMLGASHYDLVLTDLRMPGLDGIELVGEIRRQEAAGLRPGRLPVLGLTAQIVAGEGDRCLAAGMDGCLTKPLNLMELRQALGRWAGAAPQPAIGQTGAAHPDHDNAPIDRSALVDIVGEDPALIQELLGDFLRINAALVLQLADLAGRSDFENLAAAAHRLLGSAKTAGAAPLARVLAALEQAAQQRLEAETVTLTLQARDEFDRVRDYLSLRIC